MFDRAGYSDGPLDWDYLVSTTGRWSTATFEQEQSLIGSRISILVKAAKRKTADGAVGTIQNTINVVRICATAIAKYAKRSTDPEEWADSLVRLLQENDDLSESSKWSYCNYGFGVLKEIARTEHTQFRRMNPFTRRIVSADPLMHGDELQPLIKRARQDVLKIVKAFRAPDPVHIPFIEEARSLAKGRLFIPGDVNGRPGSQMRLLAQRWFVKTRLSLRDLTMYLYPSAYHLMPFVIALSYPLAANPDALSSLRRSAIKPINHPTKGATLVLDLQKARGPVLPYQVVDGGTLTNGWILRAVLDMTAYLIPLVKEDNADYLFLCATNQGNVGPLMGQLRALNMKLYLRDCNLPHTTLKALRSARLTDEWIRTRDYGRVWRLGGQKSLSIAAAYALRKESELVDATSIADAQRGIIAKRSTESKRIDTKGVAASLPSHACADPHDKRKPKDHNGFCASLLWPFNDEHHVLLLEPKPVAYLIRDYQVLCDAEKALAPDRFAKHYLARKRLIETDYLPLIDDDLKRRALDLIRHLPPTVSAEAL